MNADLAAHLLLIAGSLGFGIASALLPIINAEAYVLAVCVSAPLWPASFSMVALVAGTLAGKLVLFLGARHRDKLGRFLHRHGSAVTTAEAGVARGVAADLAAGEAQLEHIRARARSHDANDDLRDDPVDDAELQILADQADEPVPAGASPAARTRRHWLPKGPAWWQRTKRAIVGWGDRALGLLDKPWEAAGVLMASATLGVPPLAVTTIAAGLRTTSLPVFIACVVFGRGIRFALIAVPTLIARH